MHATERALLRAFNANPHSAQTTTQLVKTIFPDEYAVIRDGLQANNPDENKRAKRHKAKLHRQLLYYLNKLTENGVLVVDDIKERGEKSYKLAMNSGELIVKDNKETVTISRTEAPKSWVTQAQENGIVHQYNDALHKIEAYAVNAKHYPGIAHLRKDLNHLYAHIADALLITNFQQLLDQGHEALKEGLNQLIADSQDYNIAITLQIDLDTHTLSAKHHQFFAHYALHHPKRVYLLFSGSRETLHNQHSRLSDAISALAASQIKVNLHNASVDENPHFTGEAGAYRLDDKHARVLERNPGVIVGHASLAIDCARTDMHAHQLQELITDSAKTLLARTTQQRRIAARALTGLTTTGPLREQLARAATYIRLWNYEQTDAYAQLLKDARSELDRFCELESRIYSSCGVPIDYAAHLSTTFSHYGTLSARQYTKQPVYGREHLKGQELGMREQLLRSYATDRVRIFREGSFSAQELLSELLHLADTYELPLITYDFKELQKTISLESFL